MKYVALYEDFNPAESKKRNQEHKRKIVDRLNRRDNQIQNAKDRGDESKAAIYQKRKQIDQLELKKVDLKNDIIDMKEKRMKK